MSEAELVEMVVMAVTDKERDANQLDQWASQSENGGWSTHQVEPMRKYADKLRRESSTLRLAVNKWHKEHRGRCDDNHKERLNHHLVR